MVAKLVLWGFPQNIYHGMSMYELILSTISNQEVYKLKSYSKLTKLRQKKRHNFKNQPV